MPENALFNHGYLQGADGIRLYYKDTGNTDAPTVLFIHGWSQTHAAWIRQFNSELAEEFHLVSFDLRGHGYSECPAGEDHYLDGRLYADDVLAVLNHYKKKQVVLVGWSSGALVIGDYLRRHGQADISGIVMVSGLHGLGIADLGGMLGTGPAEYMPDTMADDPEIQFRAMQRCTRDMVVDITPAQLQLLTAQAMMTAPAVRAALMNRVIDNTDVLTSFSKRALIIHGRHDPFILVDAAEHLHKLCSRSTLSIYGKSAHMPFREEPIKFNSEIARFSNEISS